MKSARLFTLLALAAVPLGAQVASKKTLTLDGARRVIAAATAEAKRLNTTGVIAVVDDGGNVMALERLDNTFAAGANISIGKARTAVLFKRPTKVFEEIIKNGRTAMVALNDFTPLQGGIPITVDGQVVGGVGVSGAASAQQDEELALVGAAALAMPSADMSSNGDVHFWKNDAVAAAFAKGAVLYDGAGSDNYMVHASRREGPGMAEVHERDTDIIYVLDGSASFVTGGSVVAGKVTAPDEIRGSGINNGTKRQIAKGDVVIVPNGTPHWFESVKGPLTYYVVKVR
ncbi:MAG: heme-binding protein [Gemmatimonadota bacterium]